MADAISAKRTRQILDVAPLMVCDLDGHIRLWTTGMHRLYGYDASEAVGQVSRNLLATTFPEPICDIDAALRERGWWSGELRQIRRDRTPITVAADWSVLPADDGAPGSLVMAHVEIAQESQAQQDQQRLAAIVEGSHDAIISKTLDGLVTSWNKGAEEVFGYAAEEMISRPISVLFPAALLSDETDILERLRRGERIENYETVRLRKNGEEVHVALSVSPIRNGAGQVVGASKIARNITEQKLTQARLDTVQAELSHVARLSAMGEMSTALAHELNQPLAAISNYLSGVKRMIADQPDALSQKVRDGVNKAAAQALRCGDVIRRLREFVARGETAQGVESLARLVAETNELALVDASRLGIRVQIALNSEADLVSVDKVQIQQVLLNLIRNAVEAMADSERRELTVSSTPVADAMVEVCVSDTGAGLSEEVAARLFQPFTTTKANGMGVGLSICRTIIESQGGEIWASPNPGGGTVFHLTLCRAAAEHPDHAG